MARFPEDRTKMFLWDYFDWCQLFLLFRSNFFQSNKYLKTSYLLSVNFTPRPFELKVQNTTLEIHTGSICSSPAACFEKCHPKPSLFLVVLFFQVLDPCFNLQYLYLALSLQVTSSVACTATPDHSLQLREVRPSPGEGQFPFLIRARGQGSVFRTLAHFNPQGISHWCLRKIAHKDEVQQTAFYKN